MRFYAPTVIAANSFANMAFVAARLATFAQLVLVPLPCILRLGVCLPKNNS